MAFCSECGNNIGADKFCSKCGAASKVKTIKDNSLAEVFPCRYNTDEYDFKSHLLEKFKARFFISFQLRATYFFVLLHKYNSLGLIK